MVTIHDKLEYAKLYSDLYRAGLPKHSLFSMGNLAFFTDRCLTHPLGKNVRYKMNKFLESTNPQDKVELFYLISSEIYKKALPEGLGENMDYRMNRIQEKYERRQLDHFEVLLDEVEFPEWFQRYIPLIEAVDDQQAYASIVNEYGIEMREVAVFFKKAFESHLKWQYVLSMIEAIQHQDEDVFNQLMEMKLPTIQRKV